MRTVKSDQPRSSADNPGAVYLLGAGASRGSRHELPTMQGFFAPPLVAEARFSRLREFINGSFPQAHVEKLNLEWVLTYLDLALSSLGARWGGDSVRRETSLLLDARHELDLYITQRLKADATMREPCPHHVALGRRLADPDSILTLNYDLLMDRALHCCNDGRLERLLHLTSIPAFSGGEPMAPRPSEANPGVYIKLHGSIDWATCPRPDCGNHQHLADMRQAGWERHIEVGAPCRRCGSPLVLGIVTPSLLKEFDRLPKVALLWHIAHQKLLRCKAFYAIGVSLAPSDFGLRWLIRHSLTANRNPLEVVVVNQSEGAYREFRELLSGVNVRHDARQFQDWTADSNPGDARSNGALQRPVSGATAAAKQRPRRPARR